MNKFRFYFNFRGKGYVFERQEKDFDRNYDDEPYVYCLETNGLEEYNPDWIGFEITVFKDENNNIIPCGYVNIFLVGWDKEEICCHKCKIKKID